MNKNKIFAGLVLAIFLFAIPQVVYANGATRDIGFSGEYQSSDSRLSGEINGEIIGEKLEGSMTIRGLDCDISLSLVMKRGDLEWYSGTLTRLGRDFEMRMLIKVVPGADVIVGIFGCPELNFRGRFVASII